MEKTIVRILFCIAAVLRRYCAGIAVDFVRVLFGYALRNPGPLRRKPKQSPDKDERKPSTTLASFWGRIWAVPGLPISQAKG
ncbi:MAG TPA: hypothetical protein VF008_31800 [Niastella sp.]